MERVYWNYRTSKCREGYKSIVTQRRIDDEHGVDEEFLCSMTIYPTRDRARRSAKKLADKLNAIGKSAVR